MSPARTPANRPPKATGAARKRDPNRTLPDLGLTAALDGGSLDDRTLFEQYVANDHRGVLLIGARRRVRAMNEAARTMLAYEGDLDVPVSDVVRDIHFNFAVGEVLHDRQPAWHETYVPDPDRLLSFHLVPILTTVGEPRYVVATVEDVTRLRHLETVRRDFVANVSHELRTPIASINLLVETLQRGALDDRKAAAHFLHRIEVETRAMGRLVEELLELSRLETGVLALNLESVEVRALVTDVAHRLAPAAGERNVELTLDLQSPLPDVRADPRSMEQVLINLVHNAIKFTPPEGSVTIRAARQGRGVQIEVVDTGVGMEAAEASRVFERFYKVDKGRSRVGGAGLGLAIARHLLELHGSQLHVVSEPGRGSRFHFALPVAD